MFLNRLKALLRQSSLRQSLGLVLIFAVITSLAWAVTFWLVQREMNRLVDARLTAQMRVVVSALEQGGQLPPTPPGLMVMRLGPEAANPPFDIDAEAWAEGAEDDRVHKHDGDGPFFDDYRFVLKTSPQGRILVAENTDRQQELSGLLAVGLQVAVGASILAALLVGLWLARRNQARLDRIGDGLARVAQGQLATRIALPGPRDDLALLAERVNATTEQLERSMEQIRVQSANIAHDLRTPLARLRALIESRYLALVQQQRPVDADSLEAALAQIDHVVGTFDALLRIARVESGARKQGFAPVDLAALAEDVVEVFGPVVEDAGQRLTLQLQQPAVINGDRELLLQLCANLVQNALRYGGEGQTITLAITGRQLSIADQGPGIPVDEREKVLQPLYQLDRERQGEGFGLGLSLVRAICDLHQASLRFNDGPNGRGLSVSLRFEAGERG